MSWSQFVRKAPATLILAAGLAIGLPAVAAAGGDPPAEPFLRIETGMHTAIINRIAVDAAGRLAATASDDKTIRLWSLPDGRPAGTLRVPIGPGAEGSLYSVALSPDGALLAAGGSVCELWDGRPCLYLFDVAGGRIKARLPRLPSEILHLAFSPDGRRLAAVFGGGAGLVVYDMASGRVAGEDHDYGGQPANWATFAPDGRLATTGFDGAVRVYDSTVRLVAKRPLPGNGRPFSVAFSPDGSALAVGSFDAARVDVLSASDLRPRGTPDTAGLGGGNLAAVAWLNDGALAAGGTAGRDGRSVIRVWSGGGKGRATDIPAARDSIDEILPIGDGGAVFASADPSWGRIGGGRKLLEVGSDVANFRGLFAGRFAVSDDGLTLEFGIAANGQRPMRLDLGSHGYGPAGSPDPALAKPVTQSPALRITDWQNLPTPKLNGRPLRLDGEERARSLAIAPDGRSFLLGGDYWLRWYDAGGTLIARVSVPAAAAGIVVNRPGNLAVVALTDGTLHWYALGGRGGALEERASLFVPADGRRWVAWTPEGFFDHAEDGGKDLVGYHFNKGRIGTPDFVNFAQLYPLLHSSDLVAKKIAGGADDEIARAYAAIGDLRSRLEQHPLPKIEGLEYCWTPAGGPEQCRPAADLPTRGFRRDTGPQAPPVPAIGGTTAPTGAALTATVPAEVTRVTLRFRVVDGGGGVGDIGVFVNDRAIDRQDLTRAFRRDTSAAPAAAGQVFERVVPLDAGANRIEIRVYDGSHTAFASSGHLQLTRAEPPPAPAQAGPRAKPRLFILAAGVDKYKNPTYHLNFPVADADGVASVLRDKVADLYVPVMVPTITPARGIVFSEYKGGHAALANEDASLEMLEKAFDALASDGVLQAGDTVVIYLAGHGMRDDSGAAGGLAAGKFYFITSNVDGPETVDKQALGQEALLRHLVAINARRANILLVLDTCHSGAFARGTPLDAIANLNDEAGISVLAAAASNQEALDGYRPQGRGVALHGVFAFAVISGLGGGATADETGIIYPGALARYVKDQVVRLAAEVSHQQQAKWQPLGEQNEFPLVRKFRP